MKKFLIQVGVVVSLAGAAVTPAYAEHQRSGYTPDNSRAIVQYNDRNRRFDWRDYFREARHARKQKRNHRRQHRRQYVRHENGYRRNDDLWDGYYYADHADVHHARRHGERNFRRRQRHHQ